MFSTEFAFFSFNKSKFHRAKMCPDTKSFFEENVNFSFRSISGVVAGESQMNRCKCNIYLFRGEPLLFMRRDTEKRVTLVLSRKSHISAGFQKVMQRKAANKCFRAKTHMLRSLILFRLAKAEYSTRKIMLYGLCCICRATNQSNLQTF